MARAKTGIDPDEMRALAARILRVSRLPDQLKPALQYFVAGHCDHLDVLSEFRRVAKILVYDKPAPISKDLRMALLEWGGRHGLSGRGDDDEKTSCKTTLRWHASQLAAAQRAAALRGFPLSTYIRMATNEAAARDLAEAAEVKGRKRAS